MHRAGHIPVYVDIKDFLFTEVKDNYIMHLCKKLNVQAICKIWISPPILQTCSVSIFPKMCLTKHLSVRMLSKMKR